MWIVLSETVHLRNLPPPKKKLTFSGCLREFYHRLMYIASSSGHSLLNLNVPFKVVLYTGGWGCFLMSGVRMLHCLKDWWKFIHIHQYQAIYNGLTIYLKKLYFWQVFARCSCLATRVCWRRRWTRHAVSPCAHREVSLRWGHSREGAITLR